MNYYKHLERGRGLFNSSVKAYLGAEAEDFWKEYIQLPITKLNLANAFETSKILVQDGPEYKFQYCTPGVAGDIYSPARNSYESYNTGKELAPEDAKFLIETEYEVDDGKHYYKLYMENKTTGEVVNLYTNSKGKIFCRIAEKQREVEESRQKKQREAEESRQRNNQGYEKVVRLLEQTFNTKEVRKVVEKHGYIVDNKFYLVMEKYILEQMVSERLAQDIHLVNPVFLEPFSQIILYTPRPFYEAIRALESEDSNTFIKLLLGERLRECIQELVDSGEFTYLIGEETILNDKFSAYAV